MAALVVGQRVVADFHGQGAYYPGQIERVLGNGKYAILYDDGDFENGVLAAQIRPQGEQPQAQPQVQPRAPQPRVQPQAQQPQVQPQ